MKKRLLTLLMVIFTLPLFAQQGDVVLCEGFFNPWLEEGWDAKGDDWVVWYISNTTYAGCKPREMQMYPDFNFEGTTRLVTPIVELEKYDFINFQFNHCLEATQGELEYNQEQKADDDGHPYDADALPALQPSLAIETEGLERAPEAVTQVEPQGNKPDDVEYGKYRIAEGVDNVSVAVGRYMITYVADEFGKHHDVPEVEQVQQKSEHDDDTQHEHVLRSPLYLFRLCCDKVAILAASLAVLNRQHKGVNQVQHGESCQAQCTYQCVPVGAQKLADSIVAIFREERHRIHERMKRQKEDEANASHGHYNLLSNRRID